MNAKLRANTIKRVEGYGLKVIDSGGIHKSHHITNIGDLNDDELYLVGRVLDALKYEGRLTAVTA